MNYLLLYYFPLEAPLKPAGEDFMQSVVAKCLHTNQHVLSDCFTFTTQWLLGK